MAIGESYQGGLAYDGRSRLEGDNRYRNWVAYELSPVPNVTIAYVTGEVEVANPGIKVRLSPIISENPTVLVLRIDFIQRPGVWPDVLTWVTGKYAGALVDEGPFEDANVVSGEVIVVKVPFSR